MADEEIIDMKDVFRIKDEVIAREIAGECFLVPVRGKLADMSRIFSVNAAAEHIWKNINGQNSLRDIRDAVCSRFEVETGQAEKDVKDFLGTLLEVDLVEKVA